jgi:hypothetical protein
MCDSCEWDVVLTELEELCEADDYQWANETLAGIAGTIEEREHVTEKQLTAIENIKAAVERRG